MGNDLSTIVRSYCKAHTLAYSTVASLQSMARQWHHGKVTTKTVDAFCEERKAKLKARSYNRELISLRAVINWALEAGQLKTCQVKAKQEKTVKNMVLWLSLDDIKRIEAADLPAELATERSRFLLQCYTGLRDSDIAELRADKVTNGVLSTRLKKTGEIVSIPLTDKARQLFDEVVATRKARNSTRIAEIRQICRLAGITEPWSESYRQAGRTEEVSGQRWQFIGTHTARRSFICNLIAKGVSVDVIMAMTGHQSYDSIKPYIGIGEETKRTALTLLG